MMLQNHNLLSRLLVWLLVIFGCKVCYNDATIRRNVGFDGTRLRPGSETTSNNNNITKNSSRQLNPSIVTNVRMLVLLVRFSDQLTDRELPPKSHFENLCNTNWKSYFSTQSYGLYTLASCDVQDWVTTDNTESYYSQNAGNLVGSDLASAMFLPVLRQLDSTGFDFTPYDADLDLVLDSVLVIHSGYASEQGLGSACSANQPQNRIVSQGHSNSNYVWVSNSGLYSLGGYAIASAFDRVCPGTATWSTWGVAAHELTHTFNTPDIYDLNIRSSGSNFLGGTGTYDIMSNPFGPGEDGNAGGMTSFIKELTGWVQPIEIQYDGVYTIRNLNDFGDVYKISKGYAPSEYLLIENRQNTGYDAGLPGAGLLIYHIDNTKTQQNQAGYPGQSGWPTNGNHYRCAILQADGKYDLEQGLNNGDTGDYWVQGTALMPGNGQNYPNTDSYQNGNIVSTGITISEISASGPTMTFSVFGLGADPNGSTPVATPISPPITPTNPPVAPPTNPPVAQTNAPLTPTIAPLAPTNTPVTPTNTPVTPTNAPIITTSAPVLQTNVPVTPTTAPVPPVTTMPTPAGVAIVDSPVLSDSGGDTGSASLEDLSYIPSTAPTPIPVPTIEPTFFSANLNATTSSSPMKKSLLLTFGMLVLGTLNL